MMNSSGRRNFMQQMGRLNMHSLTVQFFLYDREGEVGNGFFVCSFQVPKVFPNMFPKMLPITPYGLPIVQLPCI
jgi:hypothetical protein